MARHFERGSVRKRQIAEASLDVIAEHGLGGFTVRAVAARLPITDGTIFRHFKNKHEIVIAAMERLEEELFTETALDETDALGRLRHFFTTRARLLGGPRAIGRLVFSEELARAAGDEGLQRVAIWRRRSASMVAECLTELEGSGWLRQDIPAPHLVRVVLGMLLTFSNERLLLHLTGELDARVELAWSTLETLLASCEREGEVYS